MRKLYEVVFYSGDARFPAYYVVDQIACENVEEELKNRLARIMQKVRNMFDIGDNIPDLKVYEALYVLQEDGLTFIKDIT